MVHSGYHPLKHRPHRIVHGWCTVDIILLSIVPHRISMLRIVHGWCTVDIILLSHRPHPLRIGAWMVHSGYHPLKHRPHRIVHGWCTVDIILLSIVLIG